ncbi:MAG: MFS transporter [Candidatus Gracilibacteria bacterium]
MAERKKTITTQLINKVLNVSKNEWGRILEAWMLRIFFQIGFVIGWTMMTAMVVNELGITFLPYLYVVNGAFIVMGTLIFSRLIYVLKNRTLIITASLLSALVLLIAVVLFKHHSIYFLLLALFSISIFATQVNILLLGFIEELFSPIENQRANPLIETSEPIGGIIAGIILSTLAGKIHVTSFTYFWIVFTLAVIPILLFFYHKKHKFIKILSKKDMAEHAQKENKMKKGLQHIKAMPFVKGLVVVVFCQWMFVNIMNYQYTKAVDSNLSHGSGHETTAVHDTKASASHEDTSHDKPVDSAHKESTEKDHAAESDTHASAPLRDYNEPPVAEASHEDALTHGLGTLHIMFSVFMLLTQLFVSSRAVNRMGIVRSLEILPGLSLLNVVAMLFNFTFFTAVLSKAIYEITLVLSNNAYHNSYYAVYESIREQIREFLEGMVRPLGVIAGTLLLIILQFTVGLAYIDTVITVVMGVILIIMIWTLYSMQDRYTQLSKKNLDIIGEHPEKFNAIEILSQQGHKEASMILTKNLIFKKETPRTKVRILKALAILKDEESLPEILTCLEDESLDVRIQACKTLAAFKNLGTKFYTQAFSKFRVMTVLSETFKREHSRELKLAIINVFASIHHSDIVPFLLECLESESDEFKADIIYIIGMFNDINAGSYIEKYLENEDPMIKANTIIALWRFKKYRLKLLIHLTAMLDDENDKARVLAGIFVLGETQSIQEAPRLFQYLESEDQEIKLYAAVALAKLGYQEAIDPLLMFMISEDHAIAQKTKELLMYVDEKFMKFFRSHLEQHIHILISNDFGDKRHISTEEITLHQLDKLKYYYNLLEYDQGILRIEKVLDEKKKGESGLVSLHTTKT